MTILQKVNKQAAELGIEISIDTSPGSTKIIAAKLIAPAGYVWRGFEGKEYKYVYRLRSMSPGKFWKHVLWAMSKNNLVSEEE